MTPEHPNELAPCPICGLPAYVFHDYDRYDRADYGWEAGCPRYARSDGIHGIEIDQDVSASEIPRVMFQQSKQAAILAWNRWVTNWTEAHNAQKTE